RNQEPHLRTEYRRTAFQLSSTNAVRISLDTQLAMTRELGAPRAPGGWCRDPSITVRHEDVVRFPYAVLEIKLQDEDSCPAWVLALRQSGLLVEAPKFSKFLHGMALLYPQRLRNTPHWFLPELPPTLPPHRNHHNHHNHRNHQQNQNQNQPDRLGITPEVTGTGVGAVHSSRTRSGSMGWIHSTLWLRGRPRSRSATGVRAVRGGWGGPMVPAMSPATLQELSYTGDKYAHVCAHQ
ncbi:hypothetical protein VaNZ11_006791, partial [Volvox africanus]